MFETIFEWVLIILFTPICAVAFMSYFGLIVDRQVYLLSALYGKINPMEVTYPEGLTVEDGLAVLNMSRKQLERLVRKGKIRTYLRNDILYLFTEDVMKYKPEPYDPKYEINDPFDFIEEEDAIAQRG